MHVSQSYVNFPVSKFSSVNNNKDVFIPKIDEFIFSGVGEQHSAVLPTIRSSTDNFHIIFRYISSGYFLE